MIHGNKVLTEMKKYTNNELFPYHERSYSNATIHY